MTDNIWKPVRAKDIEMACLVGKHDGCKQIYCRCVCHGNMEDIK